jgi:hypothetical protein
MKLIFTLCLVVCLTSACAIASKLEDTIKPFSNDGCSLFPDGSFKQKDLWCDCCVVHDVAYWQGGSDAQRLAADKKLRACVLSKTHNSVLAELMYQGVRVGGAAVFPNWYRWGYGWRYGVGDEALTEQQQQQVDQQLLKFAAQPELLVCPK